MSETSNQLIECILKYHLLSIVLTVTNVSEWDCDTNTFCKIIMENTAFEMDESGMFWKQSLMCITYNV